MEEYERKVKDLLNFYKDNNIEVKFKHIRNKNLEIKGRVKQLVSFFVQPYAVIDNMKIFLEDIDLDTIFPSTINLEVPKEEKEEQERVVSIMVRNSLPKKTRFEVFKRDNYTCQYCGRSPPTIVLEVDHINPLSNGGTDELSNLITSCFDCNRGKGSSK